jgi:glutamyl-tRNA synthetase
MAAYNFACVIDDHAMHVTHVIRGEDHLSNTPRQILVYRALGWEPPAFAHHPLILGPDRSPLSKRHGVTAVSHYRDEGFVPEALLNYLVLLGWTPPTGQEIFSQQEITDLFSIEAVSRSAPVFSRQKLEWLNSHYLRQKSDAELSVLLAPYLSEVGLAPDRIDPAYLARVAGALKENLVFLSEAEGYLGIFFDEKFRFHEGANALLQDAAHQETLRGILLVFNRTPVITEEDWPSFLSRLAQETGRKGRALYAPLRAAVTGMMKGPELVKTLPLLGRERVIKRIEMALETTGSG